MIHNMKRTALLTLAASCILAVSCIDYKPQIEQLQKEIADLEKNLTEIETLTANLGALRDVMTIGVSGDPIESATPSSDGYTFTFKANGSKTVGGATGGISVGAGDGAFFWMLGDSPLKDASGNNAALATILKFRAKDAGIEVSADGGKTWAAVNPDAGSVFTRVDDNAGSIFVTFLGGAMAAFQKESKLSLMLSGDSSTYASQGRVIVDYCISGGSGSYTVATSQGSGWSPQIIAENEFKGQIVFVASGKPASDEVVVYVADDAGQMVTSVINLASLQPDGNFPQMNPAYEAYNIAAAGGEVEVTVTTNQIYDIEIEPGTESWLSLASTKAVREDKLTFSATANESLQMRFAKVTLTAGNYVRSVMICQDGQRPAVGQNLSENGTANCYIIPAAGDYYFDATVIGNGQQGIIKDAGFHREDASIQPADLEIMTEFDDVTLVENLRLEDGKICFHATGAKGNLTVSALSEDEDILWTWHLWFTDMPLEKSHTNDNGQQFTLLDRNLGATSSDPADGEATFGLYYQWGRKDPFAAEEIYKLMSSNTAGTIYYSITRPFRPLKTDQTHSMNWHYTLSDSLWGNPDPHGSIPFDELVKTIYDPCPPGYMVPPANTFVIFRDNKHLNYITNGMVLTGDYGQTSFYPYAGRVYQGTWESFGHNPEEICLALWNSDPGMYNTSVYDGASCLYFRVARIQMSLNYGDYRARGIPVRCVKQAAK